MTDASPAATITHRGSCHCGAVRFEFDAPAVLDVDDCNCSICAKSAYLHLLVPRSHFRLERGADALDTYTFNTAVAQHLFCRVCGVKAFYIPRSHPHGYSVNVRCLQQHTIAGMNLTPFDGRNWEANAARLRKLPPSRT